MKRNRIQLSPTRRAILHSRPPLERMMRMHERLKAGRYPNCRKLADELEVSSKTVQRDIDFMRYRLGLPIEYDQLHFGFYYTEPVASFPNVEISEGELVALYVGQKALAQYKGTSFEAPLSTAFRKITDGLRDTISVTWSDLDSAISFRNTGRSTADVHLFEQLSHAVFKQLEVRFDYKKPDVARYEQRYVQPYHLGCVENLWYLFAFDVDRQQVRTFALPRIRSVRVSKNKFRRPLDFSIGKFLGESFRCFREAKQNQTHDPNRLRRLRRSPDRGTSMASVAKDQAAARRRNRTFVNIGKLGRHRALGSELGHSCAGAGATRAKRENCKNGGDCS